MKRILVVEDDARIALALSTRLRAAGYEVANASDALGGVNAARKETPDLVILDLMMPAGGGISVAERLRNLSDTATVPIIFLTASRNPGYRRQAAELGAHAFFEKPYDADELLRSIQEALGATA